ncbi:MAG: imidazole glycerol phosphate synthase subunit HisF, partial [Dehalococcoidia bacterium]|nr:imidazole glycerol phosphate synthase subunit HisF [Dehalococcoidia bacterium]
ERGAGELLVTSMDTDGHQSGYDIPMLRAMSEAVNVPVIASGGAGSPDHMAEALTEGKADAVLAASIFHFGTYSIREVKEALSGQGIAMRPVAARD